LTYTTLQYSNTLFSEILTPDVSGLAVVFTTLLIVTMMYGVVKLHDVLNASIIIIFLVTSAAAVYGIKICFQIFLELPKNSICMIESHLHGRRKIGLDSRKFFLACRPIRIYILNNPVQARNIFLRVLSGIVVNFLIQLLVSF